MSQLFVFMITLCLGLANMASLANAEEPTKTPPRSVHKIAAVVNDDLVSMLDVEDRIKFIIATTGLSNSDDVTKKLLPQVIRSLVDERLQLQAAKQLNITVSPKEIEGAMATIEKQRGRKPGSLIAYLTGKGISPQTFKQQLEAQLAWNKLIRRNISSKLNVSDEELAREMERTKRQRRQARKEAEISSILLPVANPEQEADIQTLATKLVKEIRGGASFEAVATQLSAQGAGKTNKIWVPLEQLDPVLAEAIAVQENTGLLEPIRTPIGYHIIQVHQMRKHQPQQDFELLFKEIVMQLKPSAEIKEVDVLMDIARSLAKHPGTCQEPGFAGMDTFEDMDIAVNQTRLKYSELSPEIKPLIEDLSISDISEPFAAPDGIHMLMLCERVALPSHKRINVEALKKQLLAEKFELEAIRYLRNLRREAFIEMRL